MASAISGAQKGGPLAELFVLAGPDAGRSFEIFSGASLGRAPDRAVVLRDKSISRHHAHFECKDGIWSIVDDGSTNGFVVDGSREKRAELTDLREFVIGEVLVRLRTKLPEAQAAPVLSVVREQAAPQQKPDEIEIEDEILLDAAPEATTITFQKRVAAAVPIQRAPSLAPAARSVSDAGFSARGQRPLQYHKQEAHRGLFVTDLAQRPLWVRALVFAVVLALAGALAWGVYHGVLSLRREKIDTTSSGEDS